MEKYNTLKNKKDFEDFILEIPKQIENLSELLGESKLDFNEKEVFEVSRIFLEMKGDGSFDNKMKKMLIVYVGELFRIHFGGEWSFTGLKSDSWAINEPVITKYKSEGMRMSPSEWIWNLFEENNPNKFNESVIYMKEFQRKTDEVFSKIFPKRKKK